MQIDRRRAFWMGSAVIAGSSLAQGSAPETAKQPIKIGQIGVGHGHASKLSVYRELPDYEVVGIVEPDARLRRRAESGPGFRNLTWMSREQLLNTPGLQAVLIETRVQDLLENAEASVLAGKHVHIDKPAGQSLVQFRKILETAQASGLLVQMGYMYRYNPGIVLLRQFLRDGWLGDLFEIHCVMSKVVEPAARLELAKFSGGMMFELGCHLVDLVISLMGRPLGVEGFHRHSSGLNDGLLDNTLAVLEYPKAIATIKSTALEVDGFSRRHLVVCGTQGTFQIQPLDNPVVRLSLSEKRSHYSSGSQEIQLPKYTRYIDDAIDMARIIRGEKASDFSYQHDLTVQETLVRACGIAGDIGEHRSDTSN